MNKTIEINITTKNAIWCFTYSIEGNADRAIFVDCDKWNNGERTTISEDNIPVTYKSIADTLIKWGYLHDRKASQFFFATSDIGDLPDGIGEKCKDISTAVYLYEHSVKIEYYMTLED